jgi:hypothetical protein
MDIEADCQEARMLRRRPFDPSRTPTPSMPAVAASALLLAACGGGSGVSSSEDPPALTTGSVAVLFTDAPTDDFCQVRATVTGIDLLSDGGATDLYSGERTIDVLAMRNFSDFFTVDPAVPIGTYSKVRLTLSDLALVECDAAGVPEPEQDWDHPNLPGNGKLDLNPRGTFEVVGGEMLVIELDLDMEKSLHVHQAGNGRWQFRPVVFVTIRPDDDRLVRVHGAARNITANSFELCPVDPVSTMDGHSTTPGNECLDVFTDLATGIFDEAADPTGLSALANDDLLTAIGFFGLHDDGDGDSRMDDLRLDAVVLEYGELGTFERLAGAVVSTPGSNDVFEFEPLGLAPLDVRLQSGTRIFAIGSDQELTSAALQPGTTGEVDGVFADPATDGEPLKASLVVLDQDTTPGASLVGATIAKIDADDDAEPATRRFEVDTATATAQCVRADVDTRYLEIAESGNASETTEIAFADLAVGDEVDVYGTSIEAGTCVLADAVQKYVTAP